MTPKSVLFSLIVSFAVFVEGQTLAAPASGAILEVLHSFNTLAGMPSARLVQGRDGDLYGTTKAGGSHKHGTIFRMTKEGSFTILHSFSEKSLAEKVNGSARLIQGSDGNFYGTTFGDDDNADSPDKGTIFKMTLEGTFTTLVRFNGTNGANPAGDLLEADDGIFYGTTSRGGSNNYGTVFTVTSEGVLTSLLAFDGRNGRHPVAGLIRASDGLFYGTTADSVFRMTPEGSWTNLVRTSESAWGPLIECRAGKFYGTTINLSDYDTPRWGTIFRLSSDGAWSVMEHLEKPVRGSGPVDGLSAGKDGSLYGITYQGGENELGTVFRISPEGVFSPLLSFNWTQGAKPFAAPIVGDDGNLYGTTTQGGLSGIGTAYRILIPPSLNLRKEADRVIVSWPTNAAHLRLQFTTDLSSPVVVWSDSVNPSTDLRGKFALSNSISGKARYYRLSQGNQE